MNTELMEREGQRLLVANEQGPKIGRPQDAVDLVSDAWEHQASVVAVPVARFDPEFFRLRTGKAGEFVQKMVNYRCKLAIMGDLSEQIAASDALRDFVGSWWGNWWLPRNSGGRWPDFLHFVE